MAQALRSSELGPCSALKSVTPLDRELFSVHENSFSEDLLFSESSPDFDVFLSENCYFSPPASPGKPQGQAQSRFFFMASIYFQGPRKPSSRGRRLSPEPELPRCCPPARTCTFFVSAKAPSGTFCCNSPRKKGTGSVDSRQEGSRMGKGHKTCFGRLYTLKLDSIAELPTRKRRALERLSDFTVQGVRFCFPKARKRQCRRVDAVNSSSVACEASCLLSCVETAGLAYDADCKTACAFLARYRAPSGTLRQQGKITEDVHASAFL